MRIAQETCVLLRGPENFVISFAAVTCPALEAPFNGMQLSCSGKTIEYYNTVCLFSCCIGFNEFGCPSRKCLENGTWSGKDFLCTGNHSVYSPQVEIQSFLSIIDRVLLVHLFESPFIVHL